MEDEVMLHLANGYSLRSGSTSDEFLCGEWVRLVDWNGKEVLYWDFEEWHKDPILVMGAIINAAVNKGIALNRPAEEEE